MIIEGPLINATFIERPNRFITIIEINGELHRSHLPDPGRLKELLTPNANLLVRPAPEASDRKTSFSTVMVEHKGQLISLVSTLPNKFIDHALKNNKIPFLRPYTFIRSEITIKNHRFDFLLNDNKANKFYLEVKSVTLVVNGIAKFPDAITRRGMNHAKALMNLVRKGFQAGILFVCQRPDATSFSPMWDRDPKFAMALSDAYKAGVKVWCITLNISKTEISFKQQIPVNLERGQ